MSASARWHRKEAANLSKRAKIAADSGDHRRAQDLSRQASQQLNAAEAAARDGS